MQTQAHDGVATAVPIAQNIKAPLEQLRLPVWDAEHLRLAIAAAGVAWLSQPGKELFAFAQEAWQEAAKVSWPSRKETIQTTAIVFAFVVVMAIFLFAVDTSLAWLVKLATGRVES